MSTKEVSLKQHITTSVNSCAITLCEFDDGEGESFYNAVVHMFVDTGTEEDFELPVITEIYHPTMSGAVYLASRVALSLSENVFDDIPVFNNDGECIVELSLGDVMKAIKEEMEAMQEQLPDGATVH